MMDSLTFGSLTHTRYQRIYSLRWVFLQAAFLFLSGADLISAKEPGFSENLSGPDASVSAPSGSGVAASAEGHLSGSIPSVSAAPASAAANGQSSSKSDEQKAVDPMNLIFYLETKDGDLPVTPQTSFSTFTHQHITHAQSTYAQNAGLDPMHQGLVPERLFSTGLWKDLQKNPKIVLSEIYNPKRWRALIHYKKRYDFPVILRNKATQKPFLVQFPLFLGEVFLSGNAITLTGETAMDTLVVGVDPSQYRGLTAGVRFGYLEHSDPTTLNIRGTLWADRCCVVKSAVHLDGALCTRAKPGQKGLIAPGLELYHSAITADTLDSKKDYRDFDANSTLDDVPDLFWTTTFKRADIRFYGNCSLTFKNKAIAKGEYSLMGDGDLFISDVAQSMNNSIATLKNVHFAPIEITCNFPTTPGKGYFDVVGTVDLTHTEIRVNCVVPEIQKFAFDKKILLIQSTTPIQGQPIRVYVSDYGHSFTDKKGRPIVFGARLEIEGNKAYIVLSKTLGKRST